MHCFIKKIHQISSNSNFDENLCGYIFLKYLKIISFMKTVRLI